MLNNITAYCKIKKQDIRLSKRSWEYKDRYYHQSMEFTGIWKRKQIVKYETVQQFKGIYSKRRETKTNNGTFFHGGKFTFPFLWLSLDQRSRSTMLKEETGVGQFRFLKNII